MQLQFFSQYVVFKLVSFENQRILRFDLDLIFNNFEILCIGATKDLSSNIHAKLTRLAAAMDKSACAIPHFKGDSYCDDINNTEGCNWDGGDCCAPHTVSSWNGYCQVSFKHKLYPSVSSLFNSEFIFQVSLSFFLSQDCQCLDPNPSETAAEELPCSHGLWPNDPFCDDGNNTPECNFDGGACCDQDSPVWNFFCTECACLE